MDDIVVIAIVGIGAVFLIVGAVLYLMKHKKPVQKKKASDVPVQPQALVQQQPVQPEPKKPALADPYKEEKPDYEHISSFFKRFPQLGNDKQKIIEELKHYDYEKFDKGQLKDYLEHHGISFTESEEIMDAIYHHFLDRKNAKVIEQEIPHYRNMGWNDEQIKQHFIKEGYQRGVVEEGFNEFHKKNIYNNYIDQIVKHMKPFVLSGKTDKEIIETFEKHNWPEHLLKEALQKTKDRLEKENSAAFLEEEILKLVLEGESKEKIAKTLTNKGWPEDELQKHFSDVSEGIGHLKKALESVDLNQYNLDRIKEALRKKNWPDEIIDHTIENLVQKVSFHRKLHQMKDEVFGLVEQGYNSVQIEQKLMSEGWDKGIVDKTIHKINRELSARGDKEKIKTFNSHVFAKDDWHKHINESFSGFDVVRPQQNTENAQQANPQESQQQNASQQGQEPQTSDKQQHNLDDLRSIVDNDETSDKQ
ncbi:MAG: hypothetical protein ACOC32_01450 [Nanoarchaeota archaeon]